MPKQALTTQQIFKALKKAEGVVDSAAETLGCSSKAIYKQIEQDVRLRRIYEQSQEDFLDLAETKLMEFVANEDEAYDPELQLEAIKFYLRTKGQQRGYVFKEEHASDQQEQPAVHKQTATVNNPNYNYEY